MNWKEISWRIQKQITKTTTHNRHTHALGIAWPKCKSIESGVVISGAPSKSLSIGFIYFGNYILQNLSVSTNWGWEKRRRRQSGYENAKPFNAFNVVESNKREHHLCNYRGLMQTTCFTCNWIQNCDTMPNSCDHTLQSVANRGREKRRWIR